MARRAAQPAADLARLRSECWWWASCGDDLTPRRPLQGDLDADVAIVGGGMTGLWTARSLAEADPSLRIVVLEAASCGFGASGRNGGWASALFPGEPSWAHEPMVAALDELLAALRADLIDAHVAHGGTLTFATSPAHVERVRAVAAEPGQRWLDREEAGRLARPEPLFGAAATPHCAAVHPARLVRGLARAVEGRDVRIFEGTRVTGLEPGRATTHGGVVRAPAVLRCVEGFTPTMPGLRRALLPVYSLMIATAPLPDRVWDDIGLHERETFTDGRHLLVYGQRTADGRLAFGGRGAPYHYGSQVRPRFDLHPRTFAALEATLRTMFPAIADHAITHRWGGPLGIPRDWAASVGFDHTTGLGWAGGYVGDGVTTTNLAGRTLADLVLGRDTPLTRLPWVGHRSPKWEPEPLRWAGVNATRALAAVGDRREARTGRPARVVDGLLARLQH